MATIKITVDIFTPLKILVVVFLVMTSCGRVYKRFMNVWEEHSAPFFRVKGDEVEAACDYEICEPTYQTAPCRSWDDHIICDKRVFITLKHIYEDRVLCSIGIKI